MVDSIESIICSRKGQTESIWSTLFRYAELKLEVEIPQKQAGKLPLLTLRRHKTRCSASLLQIPQESVLRSLNFWKWWERASKICNIHRQRVSNKRQEAGMQAPHVLKLKLQKPGRLRSLLILSRFFLWKNQRKQGGFPYKGGELEKPWQGSKVSLVSEERKNRRFFSLYWKGIFRYIL
jgi:hypothetical protein